MVAGELAIVIIKIVIFAILMAIGFAAAKTKAISREAFTALSKLVVVVQLPRLFLALWQTAAWG